jgi:hypothetical protein
MENSILNEGDYSSSHQEVKFVLKRKPDFETESLRMWVARNNERKQLQKKGSYIKHKGYKIRLLGFFVVKKKGKVAFACKAKDENKILLAYLDDNDKKLREAYNELKRCFESMGYEFRDVRKVWDNILLEEHTIKRLAKESAGTVYVKGGG